MTYDELHILQSSISPQTDMLSLGMADLIVESVVEDLEVKKKLFVNQTLSFQNRKMINDFS